MEIQSNPSRHASAQLLERLGTVSVVEILYPAPHLLVESGDDHGRRMASLLARRPFLDGLTDAGQRLLRRLNHRKGPTRPRTPLHPNLKPKEGHRLLPEIHLFRLLGIESQAQSSKHSTDFLPSRLGLVPTDDHEIIGIANLSGLESPFQLMRPPMLI